MRIRISQVKAKSAVGEVVGGKASAPVAAATGEVAASGDETIADGVAAEEEMEDDDELDEDDQ